VASTGSVQSIGQQLDGGSVHSIGQQQRSGSGEVSLESSMTDNDSSRFDVPRPQTRQRRNRGADDVFPTHAIQRCQVCGGLIVCVPDILVR